MLDGRTSPGRGLGWLLALVCVGCVLFVVRDVGHRVDGYRIAQHGVHGTVTVTRCSTGLAGSSCVGDFVSTDGTVGLTHIRVNGGTRAGQVAAAAVDGPKAGEAWVLTGSPWLRLSRADFYACVPLVVGFLVGRFMLNIWRVRAMRGRRRY